MTENEFAQRVLNIGGQAYEVGGRVRDRIMGYSSSDNDYVVTGVAVDAFIEEFPDAVTVGNSFPVYLMEIEGAKREIAFARRERKSGSGYRGFDIAASPDVTIEEDLARRDLTINSMARPLMGGQLIDPFGGRMDIRNQILRATSDHFSEDPVRALRAARLSSQLQFKIEPRTIELMRGCGDELKLEPAERVFKELEKALLTRRPSLFFTSLGRAGLLELIFPWLFDLIGKTQPEPFHPEGDVFNHTMTVLDKVALETERPEVRFAALAHDIGKGATPDELLPHHYEHEKTGLEILSALSKHLRIPSLWKKCAEIVIGEHMQAPTITRTGKIRDLLVKIAKHPIGFDGFNAAIWADSGFLPEYLEEHKKYLDVIKTVRDIPIPEKLQGAEVGRWRRQKEIEALNSFLAQEQGNAPTSQNTQFTR